MPTARESGHMPEVLSLQQDTEEQDRWPSVRPVDVRSAVLDE